jgi:transcription elongation factor
VAGARGRPKNFDRSFALQQAMKLFWARGYEGASFDELTARWASARPVSTTRSAASGIERTGKQYSAWCAAGMATPVWKVASPGPAGV